MENILNRRSERIFVVWRGNVGRNDQVYPGRRRDLVRRRTGAKAFLSFEKSRAPAADSLRKLRHAIKWQVLFGLRTSGDRLPALLSACDCRCSGFASELGLEIFRHARAAHRKTVAANERISRW